MVALAIKRSTYRVIAEKPEEPDTGVVPNDGLPMSPNGDVMLSRELLDYIVRVAVKEALDSRGNKVRKPDGWDDIVAKWKYGKLTTHKAAKMAGMSVSSFHDYATGKKTFD